MIIGEQSSEAQEESVWYRRQKNLTIDNLWKILAEKKVSVRPKSPTDADNKSKEQAISEPALTTSFHTSGASTTPAALRGVQPPSMGNFRSCASPKRSEVDRAFGDYFPLQKRSRVDSEWRRHELAEREDLARSGQTPSTASSKRVPEQHVPRELGDSLDALNKTTMDRLKVYNSLLNRNGVKSLVTSPAAEKQSSGENFARNCTRAEKLRYLSAGK